MEKIGPIEKVYEAYSAIADNRVRISEGENSAEVESSDRQKSYTITWTENLYTSNDNASYWQGYAGYPIIAVMMLQGRLPLDRAVMEHFRAIDWHQLNEKHKRDYAAAAQEAIAAKGLDPNEAKNAAEKVIDGLRTLDIVVKRGKLRPPKASK